MGDRAMAEIKVSGGSIYFYTHWYGHQLPQVAKIALEDAQPRIGDDSYATKIVIDSLLRETNSRDSELGAGIMVKPFAEDEYNNNTPSVVIDLVDNKVQVKGTHRS